MTTHSPDHTMWPPATHGMLPGHGHTLIRADRHALDIAVCAFDAPTGQDVVTPSGTDHDRFERTTEATPSC